MIFGVVNKDHSICGTEYRRDPVKLDSLKYEIAKHTGGITFREIHLVEHADGRVIMFEIPPASTGIPTSFKGHFYGRAGESRTPLGLDKLEQIRAQGMIDDWSAKICPDASISDLDPEAIMVARRNFHIPSNLVVRSQKWS